MDIQPTNQPGTSRVYIIKVIGEGHVFFQESTHKTFSFFFLNACTSQHLYDLLYKKK